MRAYSVFLASIMLFALLSGNSGFTQDVQKYRGDPSTLDEYHSSIY